MKMLEKKTIQKLNDLICSLAQSATKAVETIGGVEPEYVKALAELVSAVGVAHEGLTTVVGFTLPADEDEDEEE